MKIINRIVEAEMTADEQVELMRLEDEVADADDQLYFALESITCSLKQLDEIDEALARCERNLNNYIDSITKTVMQRIQTTSI